MKKTTYHVCIYIYVCIHVYTYKVYIIWYEYPQKLTWWGCGFRFCRHISGKHQNGLYKTKNISQNLKHGLNVLKTQNTTKSKTLLKVSSKMIPKMSLYKIKNLLGDDSRYPTISHKKMLCAKRQRVRCCRDFLLEVLILYVYVYLK